MINVTNRTTTLDWTIATRQTLFVDQTDTVEAASRFCIRITTVVFDSFFLKKPPVSDGKKKECARMNKSFFFLFLFCFDKVGSIVHTTEKR